MSKEYIEGGALIARFREGFEKRERKKGHGQTNGIQNGT